MASREERTEALSKDMKIYVSDAHIFTSDAIVLADFCAPRHKDKCCDLGTGNGIIPLLWLRDFKPKVEKTPQPKVIVEETIYVTPDYSRNKRRSLADLEDDI